jgi:DNA repair protein RecN (Recombination protein N)
MRFLSQFPPDLLQYALADAGDFPARKFSWKIVMLESLVIENYAIARKVSLGLQRGMSAITGETGAGKSIAIDALNLVLGGRADARAIRPGASSASICATFSLGDAPRALAFLRDNSLLQEEQDLCIIRRSIAAAGHSRNYINDYAVSVKMLKELAPFLLNIHGQNDGQQMLKSDRQMAFLDAFSGLGPDVSEVGSLYHTFKDGKNRLIDLARQQDEILAEYKLTHYQIAELEKFNPAENEFTEISNEYDRLSNVKVIGDGAQAALSSLNDDDDGIVSRMGSLSAQLEGLAAIDKSLRPLYDSLESARLTIEDVSEQLSDYSGSLEMDPARISVINDRLAQYADYARKYGVKPEELTGVLKSLHEKAEGFSSIKEQIEECKAAVIQAKENFLQKSRELSQKRREKAPLFAGEVTRMLRELSMPDAEFQVAFREGENISENGIDVIDFMFSANKGLAPGLIENTASGGEISRIALSVLVLTANKISAPTLIFDEIDTGISGRTAAITGKLLRLLGRHSQVITVTHLPQVAASAHHQYEVKKETVNDVTESSVTELDTAGREQEIARLLGSSEITEAALANARELLGNQARETANTTLEELLQGD